MRPIPAEDRQKIIDLYKDGMTRPAIARETGWSEGSVHNVIKAAGVQGAGRVTGIRTDPATEALVMELYNQGVTWREIMERTGRTEHTVSAIIKRNGGTIDRKGRVTPEARQRIPVLYNQGVDAPEIGRIVGCHSSSVYAVLKEAGLDRRVNGCVNSGYFDKIDTPAKAYWLGFIGADGCVTGFGSGNLRLVIKLARKDRDHLLILHKALQASRPVRDFEDWSLGQKRPYSALTVYSPALVAGLGRHGITARKTDSLQPWSGPGYLMPHYWRGLVDGDGYITINKRGVFTGLLASKAVAEAYATWVNALVGTNVHATHQKATAASWKVQVGGRHTPRFLLAALYDDAPVALARKKALADLAVHGKPLQAALL